MSVSSHRPSCRGHPRAAANGPSCLQREWEKFHTHARTRARTCTHAHPHAHTHTHTHTRTHTHTQRWKRKKKKEGDSPFLHYRTAILESGLYSHSRYFLLVRTNRHSIILPSACATTTATTTYVHTTVPMLFCRNVSSSSDSLFGFLSLLIFPAHAVKFAVLRIVAEEAISTAAAEQVAVLKYKPRNEGFLHLDMHNVS